MKNICSLLFTVITAINGYGQKHDTFQVHFDLNNTKLTQRASDFIDRLIFKDVLIHGQKLILLGYADYLGSNGHNDSLSGLRAKNVKVYLVNSGFDPKDITLCVGKGKIDRGIASKEGYAKDRKVQIIIDRSLPKAPARAAAMPDITIAKVNEAIKLKNIFFEGGTPNILPGSLPELNNLLQILINNKTLRIQIEGHVCCVGPVEGTDENGLSVYRAKAIFDYLVSKGVSKERLTYVGLGNTNPVVRDEVTEADKVQNRRVEIRILSK